MQVVWYDRKRPLLGRQATLGLLLALALALLTGCTGAHVHVVHDSPAPSLNGPLIWPGNRSIEEGMTHKPAGFLQDAGVIPLVNTGKTPVILDEVKLVPGKHASPVRLVGKFVVTGNQPLRIVAAGHWGTTLHPFKGFMVPPQRPGLLAPILVLRIGPSFTNQVHGQQFSRNNDVNLLYHTPDGTPYVVVYPVRFEYPN